MIVFIRTIGIAGAIVLAFLYIAFSGGRKVNIGEATPHSAVSSVALPLLSVESDSGKASASTATEEASEPARSLARVAASKIVPAPSFPSPLASTTSPSAAVSLPSSQIPVSSGDSSSEGFVLNEAHATSVASSSVVVSRRPPIDEAAILRAAVKIECPRPGGLGKYIGSGFALRDGVVATAGHLVMNSGEEACAVIFPDQRKPIHYLKGVIRGQTEIRKRHDEEGIDFAFLDMPAIENYPDAQAIFVEYPIVPYPVCNKAGAVGDRLLHFGYPSNFSGNSYLDVTDGELAAFADIEGVGEQLSFDQTHAYRTPQLGFSDDEAVPHPYAVSRVASFYGDSGGLAFNADRACIIGPHRAATVGRDSGDNFALIFSLGWSVAEKGD